MCIEGGELTIKGSVCSTEASHESAGSSFVTVLCDSIWDDGMTQGKGYHLLDNGVVYMRYTDGKRASEFPEVSSVWDT